MLFIEKLGRDYIYIYIYTNIYMYIVDSNESGSLR